MRILALIAALLIALASRAETLRQVLKSNGIPGDSFSEAELNGDVNAAAAAKDNRVLVVYLRVDKNNILTGNPQLIQFNRASKTAVRSEVRPEDANRCCGSPDDVEFVGDFAILSFHISPSAATMLVLANDLKLVTTLYGIDVREVAPSQLAFIENMIHFAPAHPERLELADLRSGARMELYPPKGDPLRAEFAREHARHMPPHEICMQMNDPCSPELYDEDIQFTSADGDGRFAFLVHRDASHAKAQAQEPETVASESALYRYSSRGGKWLYCEEKLSEDEVKSLTRQPGQVADSSTNGRCTPALVVIPDMSNADYSPFDNHEASQHSRSQ